MAPRLSLFSMPSATCASPPLTGLRAEASRAQAGGGSGLGGPRRRRADAACLLLITLIFLVAPALAGADTVGGLARCTVAVFEGLARTKEWSGKPPAGCPRVAVEKDASGVVVTAWGRASVGDAWEQTSFSAAMSYAELAAKGAPARAKQEILDRARRLERCLRSLLDSGDPLECRRRGSREYLVDEESGVEDRESLWLDDGGRLCLVRHSTGDSSATPTPFDSAGAGEPLPPGVNVDLFLPAPPRGRR